MCMLVDFYSGKAQLYAGYFLPKKKKVHMVTKIFAVTFMLFTKCYFYCLCFYLFLQLCTLSMHPQFAISYFFVLNALLLLQTKDNGFRASDLWHYFNLSNLSENAED